MKPEVLVKNKLVGSGDLKIVLILKFTQWKAWEPLMLVGYSWNGNHEWCEIWVKEILVGIGKLVRGRDFFILKFTQYCQSW